ncbi:transposase [Pedobacter sp. SYP-B3415]|uniref:transposase n=1 Tax=Pedobacter sp. SYP-B3415 TaxID=2496641 RepID=UPI00101C6C54|nr:transposase [Pedobacter sp. SYP-B3415]
MSRKYKFLNREGLHFVSFAVVHWIDVFVRPVYAQVVLDSLEHCRRNMGMEIYCWCIMPIHMHMIFRARDGNPDSVLGRFKQFTSRGVVNAIKDNPKESRKDWMLRLFADSGARSSNIQNNQFWRHDNKPIGVWTPAVIEQKINYIHNNPVVAGLVFEPDQYRYSSAIDYAGGKGLIDIDY